MLMHEKTCVIPIFGSRARLKTSFKSVDTTIEMTSIGTRSLEKDTELKKESRNRNQALHYIEKDFNC